MKLDTFIHQLLLENEIVIIPGFGAFISNYKAAEINQETNEIIPPSKFITFNQKIRNNDGLLVGIVAENENISHFDALKAIEKERENIIYQLDKGEKVTLEKTGILYPDENRKIQLEAFDTENLLIDSFGLEATSLTIPEEEIAQNEITTESTIENQKEEINEYENATKSKIEDQKEEINELAIAESIVEDKKEEVLDEETIVENEGDTNTESKEEKPKIIVEEKIEIEEKQNFENVPRKEPEQKKKRGWLWFLMILPVIIAGYYVANLNQNTSKTKIEPSLKKETIREKPIQENTILPDTIKKDTSENIATKAVEIDSTTIEKPEQINTKLPIYIIVGGSFKDEENAETYLQELKAKGYEPFHLGKRGSFYIVGIGRYNSFQKASEVKQEFQEKYPASGVWIKKE